METSAFSNAMSNRGRANHMNYHFKTYKYVLSAAALVLAAIAQPLSAQSDNKVNVPLSDPARPVSLRAHLVSGSLTVKGADVKEVVVEAKARGGEESSRGGRSEGMKHIPMTSTGLNIESDNNHVRVSTDAYQRTICPWSSCSALYWTRNQRYWRSFRRARISNSNGIPRCMRCPRSFRSFSRSSG